MNELNRLRRELIARLLASGLMISGCLEIIDILLFGTVDEAEQVIATSGLDNEQLVALAKALVDLTINLQS
jgi:hypothetical protein